MGYFWRLRCHLPYGTSQHRANPAKPCTRRRWRGRRSAIASLALSAQPDTSAATGYPGRSVRSVQRRTRLPSTQNPLSIVTLHSNYHSLHDGKTTHCRDRAEARRGRVGSPSLYSLVRDLPIARVESRGHRRRRALFVGAGSRARILRLRLGGRGVGLRRLVRRHGADGWVCWLCGR